jgi:hypothetical protein
VREGLFVCLFVFWGFGLGVCFRGDLGKEMGENQSCVQHGVLSLDNAAGGSSWQYTQACQGKETKAEGAKEGSHGNFDIRSQE